jgi:hypothetical protein
LALGSATSIDVDSGNGAHVCQFVGLGSAQRRDALKAAGRRLAWGGPAPPAHRGRVTKAVSGLLLPFARRGSCPGLKFVALDFIGAKHSLSSVSRGSEVLRHIATFWRDGSQPRHSPGRLPGLSICWARGAERLRSSANPLLDLQKQRDQFALAMRVRLGKDGFQLIACRLPGNLQFARRPTGRIE